MNRLAEGSFDRFLQGLGHGRMGVDGQGDILEEGAHLEGQGGFADELADTASDGDDSQQLLGVGVGDGLDESATRLESTMKTFIRWPIPLVVSIPNVPI